MNKHQKIRIYLTYAILGVLSGSTLVFGAVNYTKFQAKAPLKADDLNTRMDELAAEITKLQAQVGGNVGTLYPINGIADIVANSADVTGNISKFQDDLVLGDAISISGQIRTVTAITSQTSLSVDTPFTISASGQSILVEDKILSINDMANNPKLTVDRRGNTITSGYQIRRIAATSGVGPKSDSSATTLPGRSVTIKKLLDNTKLRLSYSDNFGANGGSNCIWDFQIDGANCPTRAFIYEGHGTGANFSPGTIKAYCDAPAGVHTITVYMSGTTVCTTNFGSGMWTLEAEEVAVAN